MFKNIAADVFGLSDIGSVIAPNDYDKVEADDYVLHEEGEKIYFLIKSKTDEYCFTNYALIHIDGTSAVSKKRLLKRLDYNYYQINEVRLETAGTIDLDIEIKFIMGEHHYSIDVSKRFISQLKDLYKSLVKIAKIQEENAQFYQYAQTSINTAATTLGRSSSNVEQFQMLNEYIFNWMKQVHATYIRKDFGAVFENFIKN